MPVTDLLLSAQATANEPSRVDGQVAPLTTNLDGRLRVATKPGFFPANVENLVALNDALEVDVTDASNIILHLKNTGSAAMAAGTFVFEGSIDSTNGIDGTWFAVQAVRTDSNTIETSRATSSLAAGAAQAYGWELSVNAIRWFRVRCTVAVTAGSIATWTAVRGSYATEPIPAAQTHAITGSVTANQPSATNYALTTAASTNPAVMKTTAGSLFEISVFNPTAAIIYVKLYNKASVAPVVGTDVPLVTIPVPVNGLVALQFGTMGKRFVSGIGVAVTAGPLSTDAVAVAAGALISASYI